jgi:phosphatidylethanolamine/phosphatidyl-N-methylethanolamine N-methyltransferase
MSTIRFLKMFIRQPKINASIIPSSKRAAKGMVSGLDLNAMKYVVELGPGTGVMTDILAEQLPPLQNKYDNRFEVVNCSASCLEDLLKERNVSQVDLVISGLPFTLPEEVKKPLYSTLYKLTEKGTCMRWFTYFPFLMKKHYKQFPYKKSCFVGWNFPPMWIYSVN